MQKVTTKPIAIQPAKSSTKSDDTKYIGTCRSYDENQPVPSFIRSLTKDTEKNNEPKPRKRLISE